MPEPGRCEVVPPGTRAVQGSQGALGVGGNLRVGNSVTFLAGTGEAECHKFFCEVTSPSSRAIRRGIWNASDLARCENANFANLINRSLIVDLAGHDLPLKSDVGNPLDLVLAHPG